MARKLLEPIPPGEILYEEFMQPLGLMLRQRHVIARLTFLEAIPARSLTRREVACVAEARVATRLGLPAPSSEPRRSPDPPA